MGWQLVTAKTQKITMPLAKSFADMEPAPGDRRLSENRLRVYERILRQGNWRPCVWSKATCEETGGVYRVNGKHTSVLFSRLAEEFPDCVVTVETYQCPTLEDVGRLYGTFDASITARTTRDINRAFSSTVAELADIPDRVIDICVTGIAVVGMAGDWRRVSVVPPQERAEAILDHTEFVLWLASLLPSSPKNRHMLRSGVSAAMFATWSKCKRDATAFWSAVRDETGETPKCPDRVLSKWLLTTQVNNGAFGSLPKSRKADIREMYVRCLHAWNAYRRKAELTHLKYRAETQVPACS